MLIYTDTICNLGFCFNCDRVFTDDDFLPTDILSAARDFFTSWWVFFKLIFSDSFAAFLLGFCAGDGLGLFYSFLRISAFFIRAAAVRGESGHMTVNYEIGFISLTWFSKVIILSIFGVFISC